MSDLIKNFFVKSIKGDVKEKYGYNFPTSNGGGVQGINDAGVETFKGTPNKHLAKEIIQNSLDAKDVHNSNPVRVEFKLKDVYVEDIPYAYELKNAFEKCKLFWETEKDRKTVDFANKGINILEKEKVRVLQISDYNTTGLKGAGEETGSIFAKLVTDSGVSNKKEGSGGSFGIGKNAPYTCSDLRTVIYSTLDEEGVQALQGVSRLVSHRNDEGILTQGKGFLGIEGENAQKDIVNYPFVKNKKLNTLDKYIENKSFIRDRQGTSIYIIGYSSFENWQDDIILAILEYYMVAIVDGDLEVVVGDYDLNRETIETCIHQFRGKFKDSSILQYYKAYKQKGDNVKIVTNNLSNMGEVKLYLLLDDEICNKKVAYIRNNGMKIIDKARFKVLSKFNGVLLFKGDEINEFIRSLENPSHDKIEPERYENPRIAKNILAEISSWIRDTINNLSMIETEELLELEGLGKYLPIEDGNKVNVDFKESVKKKIKNKQIKKVSKPKKATKLKNQEEINNDIGSQIDKNQNNENVDKEIKDDKSDSSNINNEAVSEGKKLKDINIEKSRVMLNSKEPGYKIVIKSASAGCVFIGINLIGEVGAEGAKLIEAKNEITGEKYKIRNHEFGPVEFKKGEIKKFSVQIKGKSVYSMEVETNANNR